MTPAGMTNADINNTVNFLQSSKNINHIYSPVHGRYVENNTTNEKLK